MSTFMISEQNFSNTNDTRDFFKQENKKSFLNKNILIKNKI